MNAVAANDEPSQPPPIPRNHGLANMLHDDFAAWLESIGMQQYGEQFKLHRIGFAECAKLSDADFLSMGIELVGHRKVIQESIAQWQTQQVVKASEVKRHQLNERVNKGLLRLGIGWTLLALALGVIGGISAAAEAIAADKSFETIVSYLVFGPLLIGLVGMVAYLLLLAYLWPSTMAFRKNNPFRWFILALNCLFGLTGIAWLGLLAFAWVVDGTEE